MHALSAICKQVHRHSYLLLLGAQCAAFKLAAKHLLVVSDVRVLSSA
jgi:hypothetical protein